MAKYEVVREFKDLQDGDKKYKVGKAFPSPANKKISDKRLKELSTKDNAAGYAVIKEVSEQE